MKKILSFMLAFSLLIPWVWATAPSSTYTYVSGTVINPTQVQANENNIYTYLQAGVDTFAVGSITNASISSTAGITYSKLNLAGSIQQSDIASGFLIPSGAVFFMATGSCPSGTTDISGTYSNKYVKINSTQLTSTGLALTGVTDGHQLTIAEMPAHHHTMTFNKTGGGGAGATPESLAQNATPSNLNTGDIGGDGTHSHTISTSNISTLEPASITMKACQVN